MAGYGGYGNGQSGYGQGNPYDQRNQYDQRPSNPYAQQQSNPYAQQQNGGYGNDMEMGPVQNNTGGYGQQQPARDDPMAVLNECRDIDRGIDSIYQNLERLQYLQQSSLDDPDASQNTRTNRELDSLSAETMNLYRSFVARIKKLKSMPGAGSPQNSAQVGRVDRKLKDAIQKYQTVDADFRKKLQTQVARQYRIANPEASEAEVREAAEDTSNTQVFMQRLYQSDRRGQSQSALRAVQGRHEAIQKIERQVIELAQLFEDMNALVVQQEPQVTKIQEDAVKVEENVSQANNQLDGAIEKARARNRKKWWCLGIVVLIIIIIVVAVVAWYYTVGPGSKK